MSAPEASPLQPVRRVLVLADGKKPQVLATLAEVREFLLARVEQVDVVDDLSAFTEPFVGDPDLVLVLGGDGTMLTAARALADEPRPMLGVNFGRVGFLAPVEVTRWREVLEEVLDGRVRAEPRMRLVARVGSPEEPSHAVALNEFALQRGSVQGMVTLSLLVGGRWVGDYRADGLIVATPSGSTAYSLAAGGPILAPSMSGICLTPICPHALSHRALVLHPDSQLELRVVRASGLLTLAVDGNGYRPLEVGDSVWIERHPVPYPVLAPVDSDPWRRLRERLGWRGTVEHDETLDGGPGGGARPDRPEGIGEVL